MKIPAMPILMSPVGTDAPAKAELKLPAFSLPTFKPLPPKDNIDSLQTKEKESENREKEKNVPVLMSPVGTLKIPTFTALPPLGKSPVAVLTNTNTNTNSSVLPPLPVSSSKPIVFTMPKIPPAPPAQVAVTTTSVPVTQEITSGIPATPENPKFPTVVSPRMNEIKQIIPTLKVTSPLPNFVPSVPSVPSVVPSLPKISTSPITPTVPPSVALPSLKIPLPPSVKSPTISINLPSQDKISQAPVVLLPKEKEGVQTNLQIAEEGAKDAEFVNKEAQFQQKEKEEEEKGQKQKLPAIPTSFPKLGEVKGVQQPDTLPSLGNIPIPLTSPLPTLTIPKVSLPATSLPATVPATLPSISLPAVATVPSLPISIPAPAIPQTQKEKEEQQKQKQKAEEKEEEKPVVSFKPAIVSVANLPSPSNRKSEDSPKIKIPKVKGVSVKKMKKNETFVQPLGGSIALPGGSTIVPEIPISPPSQVVAVKTTTKATLDSTQVMENIKDIDLSRLTDERVNKKSGVTPYSIAELKTIAAGLNLAKTGNKKDLVDRIKSYILKYNPSAFD